MPEPTIRYIAKLANASPTAVSLALRDSPKISKETILRIKKIAAEAGYRINPMVSTLMAHLRSTRTTTPYVASIAFVTPRKFSHLTMPPWDAPAEVFHSARARAAMLGYILEEIPYKDLGLSSGRLNKILISRSACGIIVHHLTDLNELNGIDWSLFSLISTGGGTLNPRLHHVQPDHFQIMAKAMDEVLKLGYRRPGLYLRPFLDEVTEHRYIASYYYSQTKLKVSDRIRPLISPEDSEDTFKKWLLKHKPDVVLTGNYRVYNWMLRSGFSIPKDIGLAHLDVSPDKSDFSGICQNRKMVGAVSVDLVIAEQQRNERGIPECPRAMQIEGSWIVGKTLRAALR